MTKQNLLVKLSAYKVAFIVAGIVIIFGGAFVTRAYQSGNVAPKVVIENGNYIEASNTIEDGDTLGAATSDYSVRRLLDVNGDQTYYLTKTFTDATTTIVSFPNPFLTASTTSSASPVLRTDGTTQWIGATSTVDFVRLNITGAATSFYSIVCGASAVPSENVAIHLLGSGTVATGTLAYIENNLNLGSGVTGSSTAKIALNSSLPYFNCLLTATPGGDGTPITQASNTFDGEASIRVGRIR